MKRTCVIIALVLGLAGSASGYPYDGYQITGIRRLERVRQRLDGTGPESALPAGGRLTVADIKLNLVGDSSDSLVVFPAIDRKLQAELESLFPDRDESYSVAMMDITPGRPCRYAAIQPTRQFSPGSVGKLAIAAGLFTELQRLFPASTERRRQLLMNRMIVADEWIIHDTHDVPVFDPASGAAASRPIKLGDTFSLYEWADHMMSASANAAASIVWKEVMLMRAFGAAYPPSPAEEAAWFKTTPKLVLRDIAVAVVNEPLQKVGIREQEWRLGSFFTQRGKVFVPGSPSTGTPTGALTFLLQLERGRVVDEWSSLEIKRLLYMTARRIRYASSPTLGKAAVYFKSGSLYRCQPEPDFKCRKYMGNVENTMNSVAIVEHPDGRVYCVALMSNVLRKNSAVEHQTLATYIDRMLAK